MSSQIIEEKTPRGYIFKINIAKHQYLVFNHNGQIIYADNNNTKPFHTMDTLAFIGVYPEGEKHNLPYQLYKIQSGQIVVPYLLDPHGQRQYVFIPVPSHFDVLPIHVKRFFDISTFVSFVKKSTAPKYIVISSAFNQNDVQIIKSLCPSSLMLVVGTLKKSMENSNRAVDKISNADINLLSQNPVFLARVHLRNLDLSRVKQILLDMDITQSDTEYIIAFLDTMINHANTKEDISKVLEKILELKKAYTFYHALITKNDPKIKALIEQADKIDLATFQTLIQKVKLLFPTKEESLIFVDYENLIWEKNNE